MKFQLVCLIFGNCQIVSLWYVLFGFLFLGLYVVGFKVAGSSSTVTFHFLACRLYFSAFFMKIFLTIFIWLCFIRFQNLPLFYSFQFSVVRFYSIKCDGIQMRRSACIALIEELITVGNISRDSRQLDFFTGVLQVFYRHLNIVLFQFY